MFGVGANSWTTCSTTENSDFPDNTLGDGTFGHTVVTRSTPDGSVRDRSFANLPSARVIQFRKQAGVSKSSSKLLDFRGSLTEPLLFAVLFDGASAFCV